MEKSRISFVPDWKIMLLGRSHFQRPVDAMAEFVDNSIQACMWEDSCRISCHLFIQASTTPGPQSYLVFLDNGVGMDVDGITQFATFARGQSDKGQAPSRESEAGKMFIGKFGVGAKQAGFYLGDRLVVLSKPRQEVYRFCMDEHASSSSSESANAENPFEGVVETLNLSTTVDLLSLNDGENVPMCFQKLQPLLKQHFQDCKNGSAIVIRLRKEILNIFRRDTLENLSKNLKDIYHFHLHPNAIAFTDVATNRRFQSVRSGKPVAIEVFWNVYNHYGLREELEQPLNNSLIDFLDQCKIQNRKIRPPFEVHISLPVPGKLQPVDIFGLFWYIPFEDDREQRPPLPTLSTSLISHGSDNGNSNTSSNSSGRSADQEYQLNQCIIRCYWQNRLVPWSVLHNLPFLSAVDQQMRARIISPRWRKRVLGILFFDWNFDEIANNKLRFQHNLEQLLHQTDGVMYSPLSINDLFVKWLEKQCANDKELHFHELQPPTSGRSHKVFNKLKYGGGKLICAKDKVLLPLKEYTDTLFIPVVITGFEADKVLPVEQASYFGAGKILYQRLPEDLYGPKGSGSVATKVLYHHSIKPVSSDEIKALENLYPTSLLVSLFQKAESNPITIQNNSITVTPGQTFYKLGVQILQSEKTLVWHLPNCSDERQYRYFVSANIVDEKGKLILDLGTDNRLFSYDESLKDDAEKKPTSQKTAKLCHYSFYTVSFGNKCGTFKLHISVLNPDRQVIFQKAKPIEIKVIPQEVSRIEIVDADRLQAKLGSPISSFKFKLFDKANSPITYSETITAIFVSDMFEVVPVQGTLSLSSKKQSASNSTTPLMVLKESSSPNMLEIPNNAWKVVPLPQKLSQLKNMGILRGKDFSFSIKFTTLSNARLPEVKFSMTIFPGVPTSVVSLREIEIKLNSEKKSLHLAVVDAWGNPVVPAEHSGEQWQLKLLRGPLAFVDNKERVYVNDTGEIICINNIVAAPGYEAEGTEVEQGILLKSSFGNDVLEQYLTIKISPSYVPTKLQLYRGSDRLEDEGVLVCSPEEVISNLTYQVLDETGNEISIPSSALMKLRCSWQSKSRRENFTADGTIQDILAPRSAAGPSYNIDVTVIINGHNLTASLEVEVVADTPHHWLLNYRSFDKKAVKFSAGNICTEMKELILGSSLQDQHGNTVTQNGRQQRETVEVVSYAPILDVFVFDANNSMDIDDADELNDVTPLVSIPLVQNTELTSSVNNKRKHNIMQSGDSTKPLFILPPTFPEEVVVKLDNEVRSHEKILLRITEKTSASKIEPSEPVSCSVGLGVPHKLLISSESYGLMNPVLEGNILISSKGRLADINIHVRDKFDNPLDLKNYQMAFLNIHANGQLFPTHSVREVKNASAILSKKIEIPDSVLQDLITKAMSNKTTIPLTESSFTLGFAMTLFKANNKEKLELGFANIQCKVIVANTVTALQIDLRDSSQKVLLTKSLENNDMIIPVGSFMPSLVIRLTSEDGQPFLPDSMDYFEVKLWQINQQGKETLVNFKDFYSGHINIGGDYTGPWVEIEAKAIELTNAQFNFKVEIVYIERRNGQEILRPSAVLMMRVVPGVAERLVLKDEYLRRLKKVVSAVSSSSSSSSRLGEIGRDIHIQALDKYGNEVALSEGHILLCYVAALSTEVQAPKLSSADGSGYLLSDFPRQGLQKGRKFSCIALAGNGVNDAATDGQYTLCFSLHDSDTKLLAENREFSFDFTSNGTITRKMQELQDAMAPLQLAISQHNELKQQLALLEQKRRGLAQHLRLSGDGVMTEVQIIQYQGMIENEIKVLENQKKLLIPKKIKASHRDEALCRLLLDSNIIGRVVDLALVKDRKYIDIVSLACRRIIDAVVTSDKVSGQKVFQAGLKALPLSLILPFKGQQSYGRRLITNNAGELPLAYIEMHDPQFPNRMIDPPGNPKYIVNMLHLTPDLEYLRSTVFFNLLKDAIVFDEYWQAVSYREYLTKRGIPCPLLYSLDGKQIAKDGVLDPNDRDSISRLDFSFGEYFGGSERLEELRRDISILSELMQTTKDMMPIIEHINQATVSIAVLESKLTELKGQEQALKQSLGIR